MPFTVTSHMQESRFEEEYVSFDMLEVQNVVQIYMGILQFPLIGKDDIRPCTFYDRFM